MSAQPNAFDLAMQSIRDWIVELFEGASGIPGPLLALLVLVVVVVLVVVGLLVFGLPRLRRRRRRRRAALRRPATAATSRRCAGAPRPRAEAGDWPLAIEERFRAIVRGIVDRDLVRVHPGTTARGVADAAAVPFPGARRGPAIRRRGLRRRALPRPIGLPRATTTR